MSSPATEQIVQYKLRPFGDNIVVKRDDPDEKTKGGIVLPDIAKERPRQGIVIAVGRGRLMKDGTLLPPEAQVDDRVLFHNYAGSDFKIGSDEYLVLRESEIIGAVEEQS